MQLMNGQHTFGGGRKLFRPTFSRWLTLASSCVFTARRQYIASPTHMQLTSHLTAEL